MAQKPQIVDLRKSYMPIDPNALQENMVATNREDGEEGTFPIIPYEGYNFLPTDYGYRSYFGQNWHLDFAALTARTQFILCYQGKDLRNWLIALCENGIWLKDMTVAGAWTQVVTHTFDVDVFEMWTWCVIENDMYFYKQGKSVVYKTSHNVGNNNVEISTISPSFLNMAGQMGIFRAGTRLGFWDSANSISWSSTFDLADFIPSLETMAGNAIFAECVGYIVNIKASGEGFIVYSTGSIVGASFSNDQNQVWDAKKILEVGITNPRSVTTTNTDSEQFAWTTAGVLYLGKYNPLSGSYEYKFIIPEVYDFLKENRLPVYMDCIQERYLCFQTFDGRYIYGRTSTIADIVDPTETAVLLGEEYWDGDVTVLPDKLDGNTMRTMIEQWLRGNFPSTKTDPCI